MALLSRRTEMATVLDGAVKAPDIEAYRQKIRSGRPGACAYVTLLGLRASNPLAIAERVQKGLSFEALERFQRNAALSAKALADVVQIRLRTLNRRRVEGRLQPDESDRLVRASRVFGKALELFEGDAEAARRWLTTPQKALGGTLPLTLARTEVGAREVETLIGRLEHGIPV
jgi:putative toxin-antitoxin system antitoxin component (TIGR02293 family)